MSAFDARWQRVTCSRCKRTYTCTPDDDYYGAGQDVTGPDNGVCFSCLLIVNGMDPETTPVLAMDEDGRELDPRDLPLRPGAGGGA